MDKIKKLFPLAFTLKLDLSTVIVDTIIHLFIAFGIIIVGDLMPSLGVFGVVLYWISRVAVLYVITSIVLSILHYCKVIK